MSVLFGTETYTILACAECSLGFAITSSFKASRERDRKTFYCPAGHTQWFPGKTDAKVVEELRARVATKDDLLQSTRRELDKRYRLQRAAEGKTRAIKRRIANGVCPCCTRRFQNLAAHMKNQHPGFAGRPNDAGSEAK